MKKPNKTQISQLKNKAEVKKHLAELQKAERRNKLALASGIAGFLAMRGPLTAASFVALQAVIAKALTVAATEGRKAARRAAKAAEMGADERTEAELKAEVERDRLKAMAASAILLAFIGRSKAAAAPRPAPKAIVAEAESAITKAIVSELYTAHNLEMKALAKSNPDNPNVLVWLSTLDRRTCDRCESMHLRVAPINIGFKTEPPLHNNCRCIISIAKLK